MSYLSLEYSTFKTIVENNSFTVYFQDSHNNIKGCAWAGNGQNIYKCLILSENRSVFDTDFPFENRIAVTQEDEAVAQIAGTTNIPAGMIVSQGHAGIKENAKFQGSLITASGVDTDTFYDYLITKEVYIHGGWFWTEGGTLGDYAEFSVVDIDNTLGLHSVYGLTPGVDALELGKYVDHCYLKPNGQEITHLETPTVANVVSGLYMRTKIHTTSNTELNMGVTYLWFEA